MLKPNEQTRLATLNLILEKELSVKEASLIMKLSERHTWRLLSAYRDVGVRAVAHGNRGTRAHNAIADELRERVVRLARVNYPGLNHTHFTEVLAEKEGITLSRSTVRNILVRTGVPSHRRRRPPKYRCRRPRMPQEGMLIQIDGSNHDWLEGRGPYLTLLLAVDDATGMVPYAIFREQEDTNGYFLLIEGIIRRHGIPMAVYTDQHSVFKDPGASFRPSYSRRIGTTQFSRAMTELGISLIIAKSPQAKGRVEKLAGTFQDRLVSELRMANANNIFDSNRVLADFIPRFNARFGLVAPEIKLVYRPPSQLSLPTILCCRYTHMVARDNTIKHQGLLLQLLGDDYHRSYAGYRVELRRYPDNRMEVISGDHLINFKELPQKPRYFSAKLETEKLDIPMPRWLEDILKGAGNPNNSISADAKSRHPTPRQRALWEAVQTAKRKGLSILRIAKELKITRETVRKYAAAATPPVYQGRIRKNNTTKNNLLTKLLTD